LASLNTAICWKPLTIKILYIIKVTKLSFEQSAGTKNRYIINDLVVSSETTSGYLIILFLLNII